MVGQYFAEVARTLGRIDAESVERLVAAIRRTGDAGGTIYTLGNGGSAATASHLALDLAKNVRRPGRPNLHLVALTDNVGLLTAWANDGHYHDVFAAQLEGVIRPIDLVVAISASGNSPNVLRAVRLAREAGATTFGVTGHAGGELKDAASDCVIVPSDSVQVIEDAHLAVVHALVCALRDAP